MRFIIPREKKEDITYKDSEGKCTYKNEDKEYECLIVGISTNGTYVLETIEENNEKRNL